MTSVSIIIPTYNRADILSRAIDSVLHQTFDDFEVIIVDDGSDDNTEEVVQAYSDDRIRYIKQSNKGANVARNHGIENANGEYISFLDSDDEYLPERLERTVAALNNANKTVAGIVHQYTIIDHDGSEHPSTTQTGPITLDDLRDSYPVGGFSCMLFRRSIIEQVGGLDPKLPASQDYDLCLRVLKEQPILGISEILARCYRQQNGISASIERKQAAQNAIWKKHGAILSDDLRFRQAYSLAHQYALAGKMAEARREFWRAFRGDPDLLKLYHVVLATMGKRPFDAGMTLKRRTYGTLQSLR